MSVDVEVRGQCTACGSHETTRKGQTGNVIYRQCNECGHVFKAIRYTASQIASITTITGLVIEIKTPQFRAVRAVGERL